MESTIKSIWVRVCGNLPVCVTLSSHSAKNNWTLHGELSNHKAAERLLRVVWLSYHIPLIHSYFLLSSFIPLNHLVGLHSGAYLFLVK